MGILLLGFCFPSGFLKNVVAACCLISWPAQLVCSQGMPAGGEGWDTGMSWEKKGWERRLSWSIGDGGKEEGVTTAGYLLQTWDETGGV